MCRAFSACCPTKQQIMAACISQKSRSAFCIKGNTRNSQFSILQVLKKHLQKFSLPKNTRPIYPVKPQNAKSGAVAGPELTEQGMQLTDTTNYTTTVFAVAGPELTEQGMQLQR